VTMARTPKDKGASKDSALLSALIAKEAPPLPYDQRLEEWRQEFGRRVATTIEAITAEMAPSCPAPEIIPCFTPLHVIHDQLRAMAEYMPEAVATLDIVIPRIVARHASAANKAEAARHFAVVVEVVEQYCKTGQVEPQASKPLAMDIKKAVDALLRARKEHPAGIGMLQLALGKAKANKNSK
jgi:hypothetical protein